MSLRAHGFVFALLVLTPASARASCLGDLESLHEARTQNIHTAIARELGTTETALKDCSTQSDAQGCVTTAADSWVKSFFKKQVLDRAGAFKGKHLRNNKVCRANFSKSIGLAWSFQLLGYWGDSKARAAEGKPTQDFPFDLLANTTLLVWLQQEIACAQTFGSTSDVFAIKNQVSQNAIAGYWRQSWDRYRELLITIPFGVVSYSTLATSEDFIRFEIDQNRDGKSDRPNVFSKEYLSSYFNHAAFIASLETVLFARMSYGTAPLELKWIPRLKEIMGARGAKLVADGGEWLLYRIPMGVVDGQILIWWKGKSVEV
ncbi:MAG: hypothetical protein ABIR96_01565, partial [Bdellovibrionota bacterium]